jgi:hypothetical protein
MSTVWPGARPWIWSVTELADTAAACARALDDTCLEERLKPLPSPRRSRTFLEPERTTLA